MLKGSRGFTLIELIAMLVLIGILSAAAMPTILDLQAEARTAVLQDLMGKMRTASNMVRAQAVLQRQVGPVGSVVINGVAITTKYGYPDGTATGIRLAVPTLNSHEQDGYVPNGGLVGSLIDPPNERVYYFGYSPIDGAWNTCFVTYIAPENPGEVPEIYIEGTITWSYSELDSCRNDIGAWGPGIY